MGNQQSPLLPGEKSQHKAKIPFVRFVLVAVSTTWLVSHAANFVSGHFRYRPGLSLSGLGGMAPGGCPQVDALLPEQNSELWKSIGETIGTDAFKVRAVDWLAGAVKIP